ncbi:reverse transcriptase [Gossypium australe]|uniref:Reverse transcriptase n=1 Tax=Gossypium australe TaxID=47621 RepID=A0A5B6VLH5_9ROSI|nr:reverse transcriptase [Gossypium australe]
MRLKLGNLMDKEEKYWAQRSRITWLREGDKNTRFFHIRASNRRKKNNIERLKDINGARRTTPKISVRRLGREMNDKLLEDFKDEEIKRAFNQMDSRKAPGIDGLSGNFFKENWDVVGVDILQLVVYKNVAKVLANRLKDALLKSISQSQSAFVSGRMIHDNILITHELVHYLQSATNSPNKGLVVKLDMKKRMIGLGGNSLKQL